jgi:protein TonB
MQSVMISPGPQMIRAFALAVAAELALAALLLWWSSVDMKPAAVKAPLVLHLVMAPPAPPKVAPPPKPVMPKPLPPKPVVKPKPVPKPKPVVHRVVHHPVHHRPVHHRPIHRQPQPVAKPVPVPVAVPQPPAPPAPVVTSPDPMPSFEQRVRAAIQAAVHYPPAARMMGSQGRARVGFDFDDGAISDVHILQGSGFPALDQAAVAAVDQARYPSPPPGLAHRLLHLALWVRFQLRTP